MIVIVAVRGVPGTLRRRLTASPRLRVLRLLRETSPGLLVMLGLFVAADAVLPNLALVALGRAVGRIPAAAPTASARPPATRCWSRSPSARPLYALSLLR